MFNLVTDVSLVAFRHQFLELEIDADEIVEKFSGQIPVDNLAGRFWFSLKVKINCIRIHYN